MGMNRYLDWEIDQLNPRTKIRSTLGSRRGTLILTVVGALLFLYGISHLNRLCHLLSPLALVLVWGYSWMKRFTVWCHLGLGLALSAAPLGAWAAVRGDLMSAIPWVLALAVLCWVFGFDLIYATQDAEFDREAGLFSIPAKWGVERSLVIARGAHGMTALALGLFGFLSHLTLTYWIAWIAVLVALIYEHFLCREARDLGEINRAFFFVNGVIGILLFAGVAWGLSLSSF